MVKCAVLGCTINEYNRINGFTFHKFPEDVHRRLKWMHATNRPRWIPNKWSRICSKHFKPGCFRIRNKERTMLYESAVPMEYLHRPSSIEPLPPLHWTPKVSTPISGSKDNRTMPKEAQRFDCDSMWSRGRCRCCLTVGYHSTMNTVFQGINTTSSSYTKILESMYHLTLTKIQVGHEEKLQLICHSCEERLQSAYNLYLKIQTSEETLLRQLKKMSKSKDQPLYLKTDESVFYRSNRKCYIIKNPEFVREDLYKMFADRSPTVLNKPNAQESQINEETNVFGEVKNYPNWDDIDDDDSDFIIEKGEITNELHLKVSTVKKEKNETVTTVILDSEEEGEVEEITSILNVSEKNYKTEPEDLDRSSIEDSPKDCRAIVYLANDIVAKDPSKISFNDQPVKVNTAVPIKTVLVDTAITANSFIDVTAVNNIAGIKTELEEECNATKTEVCLKTDFDLDIVKNEIKRELNYTTETAKESIDIKRHIEESAVNTDTTMIDESDGAPLSIKHTNPVNNIAGIKTELEEECNATKTEVCLKTDFDLDIVKNEIKSELNYTTETTKESIDIKRHIEESAVNTDTTMIDESDGAPLSIKPTNPYIPVKTYKPIRNKQTKATSSITNTDSTIDMPTSTPTEIDSDNSAESKKSIPKDAAKMFLTLMRDEVLLSENKSTVGTKMHLNRGSMGDPLGDLDCETKTHLDGDIVTNDNSKTDSNDRNAKAKTPVQMNEIYGNVMTMDLDGAVITDKATECETQILVKSNTAVPTETEIDVIETTGTALRRKTDIKDTIDMFQAKVCEKQHINDAVMKINTPVVIRKDLNETIVPTNTPVFTKRGLERDAVTHTLSVRIKSEKEDGVAPTNAEVLTKTDTDDTVVSKDTHTLIKTGPQNIVVLNMPEKIEFDYTVDTTKESVQGHVKDSVVNQQHYNHNQCKPMLLNAFTDVAKKRRLKDTSVTTPNERGTFMAQRINKKKIAIKPNIVRNVPTEATTSNANIYGTIDMDTSVPTEIYSGSAEGEKHNDSDFVMDENLVETNTKPVHCVYCHKGFRSKRHRDVHYKKCIVLKRKALKMKCSFCLAVMGYNYKDISEHMLRVHGFTTVVRNKIKPTKDEHCAVTAETSCDTYGQGPINSCVVSESQPLKCPKCALTFDLSVKMLLLKHMLSAHPTPHSPNRV